MSQSNEIKAAALKSAMKAEFEGYHFYTMAAKASEDPKAKEVFVRLAEEELDHFEFLKKNLESILATGKIDAQAKLGPRADLIGASPIFSDAIRARLGDAHFEMTALSVAIQLERDAETYYRKVAAESDDPSLASLYTELAEWESGHYRAFLAQQDELKEDYWAAAGFAPF